MDDLYKLIEGKCKERGIKISKLCTDVGIRQSILSDLKHGRTKTLSVPTASKLAEYFGVDVTEFLDYASEDSAGSYYATRNKKPPECSSTQTANDTTNRNHNKAKGGSITV